MFEKGRLFVCENKSMWKIGHKSREEQNQRRQNMKEKSDINKLLEGRCRGQGVEYVAFKKANESHSIGTATAIYDPIAGRTVDVLSMNEFRFFMITRFDPKVVEIKEQMLMIPGLVAKAAAKNGFRIPTNILTTDFVVFYEDGTIKAFSVKSSKKIFDKERYKDKGKWRALVRRQKLERDYWELLGVEWSIIYGDELNVMEAANIRACLKCYNKQNVSTIDHMYRYLIAHHHVAVDLTQKIHFAKVAKENEEEIRRLYKEVTDNGTKTCIGTRENNLLRGNHL